MSKRDYAEVQVLGVEVRDGQLIERKTQTYDRDRLREQIETTYSKPSEDTPKRTLVLYTSGGELCTKEFDGTWTLAQVSKWEKERFVEE